MKRFNYLLSFALLFTFACGGGEGNDDQPMSPPATAEGNVEGVDVTVKYSSPRVRNRQGKIWGDMLPYGEVWRAGANEATLVTFSQPVQVEGQPLEAGSYSLFMIPGEEEWTVVFNEATDIWGTEYESVKDQNALEVNVSPVKHEALSEDLSYEITDNGIRLKWEYLEVPLAVSAG